MNHCDKHDLLRLLNGEADFDEKLVLLAHVGKCDECAALLASAAEELETPPVPADLAQNVLLRVKPHEKKESFTFFVIRTVAAVCAALVLLFSGTLDKAASLDLSWLGEKGGSISRRVEEKLQSFSDKITIWEDTSNEQSKK